LDAAQSKPDGAYVWGRLSALGLTIAAITGIVDQAAKLWLLFDVDLANRPPVAVTPFVDLVLTWNTGISYGLFPQEGPTGPWVLLASASLSVARSAMPLIGCIGRESWILCCSTLTLRPGASAGTCSTSPMWPLLRV
jgi:hypothetical protein